MGQSIFLIPGPIYQAKAMKFGRNVTSNILLKKASSFFIIEAKIVL